MAGCAGPWPSNIAKMEVKNPAIQDHSQSSSGRLEVQLSELLTRPQNERVRALAARFAPLIRLDANEPFRPLAAGYTIFRQDGRSPSFPRRIHLRRGRRPAAALAIEYAIWWDWDINHLYELEHIWPYVDPEEQIVAVEGSWHGQVNDLSTDGRPVTSGSNPVVLAAPGKHAFAPSIAHFQENQARVPGLTTRFAGTSRKQKSCGPFGLSRNRSHRLPRPTAIYVLLMFAQIPE